jgi:hypothetical protein
MTWAYFQKLGFIKIGDYDGYLMVQLDGVEIHFFEFKEMNPKNNYGQVYIRTDSIESLYKSYEDAGIEIHPNGHLESKSWGQKEFALLDPDLNLLTFGQRL